VLLTILMIKIDPTYAKAYNKIGFILAQQGKLQGAREFLKKATQLDPDDLKARDYLEILNRKILPEIELQQ
jgi:tetratricopeptide (TPR) repeat protein